MSRLLLIVMLLGLFGLPLSAQESPPLPHRCINLGNTLEAPVEGEWGFVIAESDMQTIAAAGFDTVRIPIRWSVHAAAETPYTINPEFFDRIDTVINWALDANLQPIINIHHYDALIADPPAHRERLLAIWNQIATHYQDFPPELIFEILNEPNNRLNARLWNDYQLAAIETIRETNPQRRLVIGQTEWNSVWELHRLELPEDTRNLIATFHNYEPFQFTHQGAEWVDGADDWLGWTWSDALERRSMQRLFDVAAKWSADNDDLPVLLGEFGAYSKADLDSRLSWTRAVVEEAEERNIGWCYWEFAAGFGIYDRTQGEFNAIYRALIPEETTS